MLTHQFATILGDIPSDWSVTPVRDVLIRAESVSGDWGEDTGAVELKVLRSTNFTNDGHLDLSDIAQRWYSEDKAADLALQRYDILLERSGGGPDQPVGRVVFVDHDLPGFGFGNFIHRLRPDVGQIEPRYLRWALHEIHRSGVIERLQYQTTQMRNLDFRDYSRVLLPLPSRDEQERIADAIDRCDEVVMVSKQMLGIRRSLHRDEMRGPLNVLKTSLLQNLLTGRVRLDGQVLS
jgi:type I restriction enzyme S subunit